jgi:hypothetical protein
MPRRTVAEVSVSEQLSRVSILPEISTHGKERVEGDRETQAAPGMPTPALD